MDLYSSGYPIKVTFSHILNFVIEYSIKNAQQSKTFYSGRVYTFNDGTGGVSTTIDIAPIIRQYVGYEIGDKMLIDSEEGDTIETNDDGTVTTSDRRSYNQFLITANCAITAPTPLADGTVLFYVKYDYNTDYQSIIPSCGFLNHNLDLHVDPRQMIFVNSYGTYSDEATSVSFVSRVIRNKVSIGTFYIGGYNESTGGIRVASKSLTRLSNNPIQLQEGDFITIDFGITSEMSGDKYYSIVYEVVKPCKNRYALYYVNKFGGMDTLLCNGKYVESWNAERTDVKLYGDRSNRMSWEQKRIHQEISHQWELNTGFLSWNETVSYGDGLTAKGVRGIDHLIYSPKVYLHDLENDTLTPALVTDTSYQVKRRENGDKPFYKINVVSSQRQLRN